MITIVGWSLMQGGNFMKRKKILLFSIHAGGGHIAAAQAVKDYLQDTYEIIDISLFHDVLCHIDPVSFITSKQANIPDVYNYFARKKKNTLLNTMGHACKYVLPVFAKKTQSLINKAIKKANPDLVISVIPIVNGLIASAADTYTIPFILIPTDLDTQWFTWFFPEKLYQNGMFTIPFDEPTIIKNSNLELLGIDTRVIGFPIRRSFCEQKDIIALKKELGIQDDIPAVLMLMGAQGSYASYEYCKRLASFDVPFYLFVCLGKNESLRNKLLSLQFPSQIHMKLFEFTDRIADLMAVSDICLSKSGSVSVCEALYMNVPLILDNAVTALQWERFNHDFIKSHGFGDVVDSYADIDVVLKRFITDTAYLSRLKTNISLYKKENFGIHIIKLVHEMLENKT
jgi:processive 1,2-diacylglycerol beta-glucosyltransferase